MKIYHVGTALVVFACLLTANPATADVSTLQALLDGGTLSNQNTVFSNFELVSDIGTNAIDASMVSVETLDGATGLNFVGNGQFALDAGDNSIIFQLIFNASTNGSMWQSSGVDLSGGGPNVSGSGLVDVFNTITDPNDMFLAETNAILDPAFGINVLADSGTLASSQSDVNFVSSFSLFADSGLATSIDSYQVTLSVPEPSGLMALLLLSAFTTAYRKR